jgi:hypothetical protein
MAHYTIGVPPMKFTLTTNKQSPESKLHSNAGFQANYMTEQMPPPAHARRNMVISRAGITRFPAMRPALWNDIMLLPYLFLLRVRERQ